MTLRQELEKLADNICTLKSTNPNIYELVEGKKAKVSEALTAIEKLIDERYILKSEVKKSVEEIDKALKGENNQ